MGRIREAIERLAPWVFVCDAIRENNEALDAAVHELRMASARYSQAAIRMDRRKDDRKPQPQ